MILQRIHSLQATHNTETNHANMYNKETYDQIG